jgi:hypothetical protein
MFLILEHNDDAILAKLVDRRICELRTILRRHENEGCCHDAEHELSAMERIQHRLHEASYDVRC